MKHTINNSKRLLVATAAILALQAMPNKLLAQANTQLKVALRKANGLGDTELVSDLKALKFVDGKLTDESLTVLGMFNGLPIVKTTGGNMYTINTANGNVTEITAEKLGSVNSEKIRANKAVKIYPAKQYQGVGIKGNAKNGYWKFGDDAAYQKIGYLGIDKDGHAIFRKDKTEPFYFDTATGDMLSYVGHVTLLK